MSEIAKKVDAKTAALVADALDPENRGGSTLFAPLHLELDLEETRNWCAGNAYFDNVELPRFGLLSLMLQTTPCMVYGHPEMKKKFGKTAWTDGIHIFICDDFYEKLLKDSRETKGTEYGIELLLMHEVMHVLFNHVYRLMKFPPNIRNRATDLSINTKLQVGFPDLPWCKTLRETGVGFQPGDKEKYPKLAEETIARELVNEQFKREQEQKKKDEDEQKKKQKEDKKSKNKKEPSDGGQPQNGDGEPGGDPDGEPNGDADQDNDSSGQPGKGGKPSKGGGKGPRGDDSEEPSEGDEQNADNQPGGDQEGQGGQSQGEDEPDDGFGGEDDNHLFDLKDVIESLKEMGLDKVVEALNYPDPEDADAIEAKENEAKMRQIEAVQKAASQMARNGGKYPGAHIVEAAADMVKGFVKGKMSFRLALREAIFGDGIRFKYNEEEPGDIYFIEEVAEAAGTEVYVGQDLPYKPDEAVLVLLDTSGSVDESDIRAFLSEVFELKTAANGFGDQAAEVIVVCADTVMRGEPTEITDSNVDELLHKGVKIFGRGGTDVENSVRQALLLPQFREKKIRSVIVMSDLYTDHPKKEVMGVPDDCSFVYVTAPSTASSHEAEFAKGVESYARVVSIREGTEVDLSEDYMDMPAPNKRIKMKRA